MTVQLENESVDIYNVCYHPGNQLEADELLTLCATTSIFIGGDFNTHHQVLGSTSNNSTGHHLAESMQSVPEATLLNTGEPTYIAGGILDLSFTSPHLSLMGERSLCHHRLPQKSYTAASFNNLKMEHQEGRLYKVQGYAPPTASNT